MKLFQKIKSPNGRRRVYFCGIKIASYKKERKRERERVLCLVPLEYLKAQNICLVHPVGVVISAQATIGKNCRIWQNVTIGAKDVDNCGKSIHYPTIGDNVLIYAGAVVIGPIKVGNNAIIGANAVVLSDVPENAIVAGIPAKVIKYRDTSMTI